MSNETSRVEAAARAVDPYTMAQESPLYDRWKDDVRTEVTAALAAADADDLANGIRRVRVDEALVEKALCDWIDTNGVKLQGATPSMLVSVIRSAVLAAATDGADG